LLLKMAACIERSGKKYQISTSGQMIATTRRRMIYRKLSGILPHSPSTGASHTSATGPSSALYPAHLIEGVMGTGPSQKKRRAISMPPTVLHPMAQQSEATPSQGTSAVSTSAPAVTNNMWVNPAYAHPNHANDVANAMIGGLPSKNPRGRPRKSYTTTGPQHHYNVSSTTGKSVGAVTAIDMQTMSFPASHYASNPPVPNIAALRAQQQQHQQQMQYHSPLAYPPHLQRSAISIGGNNITIGGALIPSPPVNDETVSNSNNNTNNNSNNNSNSVVDTESPSAAATTAVAEIEPVNDDSNGTAPVTSANILANTTIAGNPVVNTLSLALPNTTIGTTTNAIAGIPDQSVVKTVIYR